MQFKALLAAPLVAWLMVASAATIQKPQYWSYSSSGANAQKYQMGVDTAVTWEGKPALTVAGTGMPTIAAADIHTYTGAAGYTSRRIRFSGMLKMADVDGWAGIYLLAGDGTRLHINPSSPLPPAVGGNGSSAKWLPSAVVVDVPADASSIRIGLILVGNGQAWLSDLKFEEVGTDVPLTTSIVGFDVMEWKRQHDAEVAARNQKGKQAPVNLELKTE